ncbi:MarR family winged helix-turn-helix transcriptional regulator [Ilumatobacter sp.]|uniref:MarR family winged helix-turn-helix transcriptional regulator n=1 Tax=Ilumatobacter sp. TaxID=1967498 RepID=UPI003AF486DF
MDRQLRDRRIIVAALVWGADLERSADRTARALTPGLNARDILLLAALAFDRNGRALPSQLIGPVHTTAAGISGSLDRLEAAQLVQRQIGSDARTRPIQITRAGTDLLTDILAPWQEWFDGALERLDDNERADLYRLLVKASGLWDDVWPARYDDETTS